MPAPKFPVSVKGVIFLDRRVVLLRNGRGEWELPGGGLEAGCRIVHGKFPKMADGK